MDFDSAIFVDSFSSITDPLEFERALSQFCESLGFLQHRLAIMLPQKNMTRPRAEIFSRCSKEWVDRYTCENLVAKDPVIYRCQHQSTPVFWSDLYSQPDLPDGFIEVMLEARKYGLYNGCSFPLRGPRGEFGIFSLITADPDFDVKEAVKGVRGMIDYVLDAAIRVCTEVYPRNPLTLREIECLIWLADGKTAIETGKILGITPRTVNSHASSAVSKLGASSRTHAILLAAMGGMMQPDLADVSIRNHTD